MKNSIAKISLLTAIGILIGCSSPKNRNVEKATYVQDGDTINPMEGAGEGTAGNKFMESANNSDSSQQIQQDLSAD